MAKSFPVGFRIHIPQPVEVKMVSTTLAQRDSIHEFERFRGLFTYVVEEDTFYYLSGGTTNSHWKPIGKSEIHAVEILDDFEDTPQKIISGHGLKKYLDANYMTATEIEAAIEAVRVPDHVRLITEQQIQKWESIKGDRHVIHNQTSPSMTWVVNHQMNKRPALQVFLSDNRKIEGRTEHLDSNVSIIRFSRPYTGYVTAN